MQFLVLSVLAFAAVISAQSILGNGGLRDVGANIGGQIGTGLGGGFAGALENTIGGINPLLPVSGGKRPQFGHDIPGYDSGFGGRYESGSRGEDRRFYENQSSDRAFQSGQSYQREKTVNEREQSNGYESARGGQGSIRGGSNSAYDNYSRGNENYGRRFVRALHRKTRA